MNFTVDQFRQPALDFAKQDFISLESTQTVAEALETIRKSQSTGRIIYFYTIDSEGRLVGVLPTRRLLLSPADTSLASIMIAPVETLPLTATLEDACHQFAKHRLLAYPIVSAKGHVLGVIDVEVYTDQLSELARREESDAAFQMIGIRLQQVREGSLWKVYRLRFPWLLCNIAGGIACAFISEQYAEFLATAIVLAMFIPVVLTLAESVSIQSLTLMLQVYESSAAHLCFWTQVGKELIVALALGASCGTIVGGLAAVWQGQPAVGFAIGATITLTVAFAALFGLLIPGVLRSLAKDPKVASGPLVLALTDLATLGTYLFLSYSLLGAVAR